MAERYATPLPQLTEEVAVLAARVDGHLRREGTDQEVCPTRIIETSGYGKLLEQISGTRTAGQARAAQAVNTQLIETYWQVGRHIVEFEQAGNLRAEYGKALLSQLAADLGVRHGKGFNRSNLIYMRMFYLRYPISAMPSHLLSWSHYLELLKLDDDLERGFYEKQAIAERWSVAELKR
ncbi:MAG: hypothetical protein K2X03_01375 [Bryobacteraceae bacterium]|nr:hypothetical protein [Bryobacteraceae bacterium]